MKTQFMLSLIGALVFVALADNLASSYFNNPQATIMIYILAGTFALFPFNTVYNALHGFQNLFAFAQIGAAKNFFTLVFTSILFYYYTPSATHPALAVLLTYLVLPFIGIRSLLSVNFPDFFKTKAKITKSLKHKLYSFGFPILLTTIGTMLISHSDTLILTYFRPLEEVGLYNVALPLAMALWLAVSSINAVILPMSSEMWARGHKKSLQTGIASLYRYILLALIPASLLLLTFPEIIITLLFAQKYAAAADALRILTFGGLLGSLALLNNSVLSGIGKPKIVSKIMSTAVIVNIVLNIGLIPIYGIIGAASATTISYILMFIASLYYIEKVIYVGIPAKFWIKMILNGIIFVSVVQIAKGILDLHPLLEASIAIGVAGIIYLGLAYMIKLINITELKDLFKHLVKKE